MSVAGLVSPAGLVNHEPIIPFSHSHRSRRRREDKVPLEEEIQEIEELERSIEKYEDRLTQDGSKYRQQGLDDVNWGLTILANGIKFVSAILTVLGGDNTDRNDGYDEAVSSLFSISGAVLRFASNYILSNPQTPAVDKLGIAASTTPLTQTQILQQNKVQSFVASLSPTQIQEQQQIVLKHVQQEAFNQKLTEAQAQLLLAQTLSHNGLPQLVTPGAGSTVTAAATGAVGSLLSGANSLLSSVVGGGGSTGTVAATTGPATPGLPTPGTLEHTIMLTLFKANQGLNQFVNTITGNSVSNQPAALNKIGQAADAADNEAATGGTGILSAVALLPQSVKQAATQVVKFMNPSTSLGSPPADSTTYSEVTTGVNPAYAALGVLTTGALGSVLYSYAANSKSDLATSATSLAQGALDAVRRNDFVEAAGNVIGSITGNKKKFEQEPYGEHDPYYDYDGYGQTYNGVYADAGYNQGYADYGYGYPVGSEGYYDEDPRIENYVNLKEYPDYEYVDPRERTQGSDLTDSYQTNFPSTSTVDSTGEESKLVETPSGNDGYYRTPGQIEDKVDTPVGLPNGIPPNVEFFEPDNTKHPEVPFVTYTEKHNPWHYLETGESTQHLYRNFK